MKSFGVIWNVESSDFIGGDRVIYISIGKVGNTNIIDGGEVIESYMESGKHLHYMCIY